MEKCGSLRIVLIQQQRRHISLDTGGWNQYNAALYNNETLFILIQEL